MKINRKYSIITLFLIIILSFLWSSSTNLPDNERVNLSCIDSLVFSQDDTLSLLTWNIGYLSGMTNNLNVSRSKTFFDQNLSQAQQVLRKYQPDFLSIQEIDINSQRSFQINQARELQDQLAFNCSYVSINWAKNYVPFPYWPPSAHFGKMVSGQALMSKYPIVGDTTVVLTQPLNATFIYKAFYLDRLIQIVDIKLNEEVVIKVMNVHLEAFDEATRFEQTKIVKSIYESYAPSMPVILAGDFNFTPEQSSTKQTAYGLLASAKHIKHGLVGSSQEESKGYYTYSSANPVRMIDYIFYNENFIQYAQTEVLQNVGQISDHFPVIMQFVLH